MTGSLNNHNVSRKIADVILIIVFKANQLYPEGNISCQCDCNVPCLYFCVQYLVLPTLYITVDGKPARTVEYFVKGTSVNITCFSLGATPRNNLSFNLNGDVVYYAEEVQYSQHNSTFNSNLTFTIDLKTEEVASCTSIMTESNVQHTVELTLKAYGKQRVGEISKHEACVQDGIEK